MLNTQFKILECSEFSDKESQQWWLNTSSETCNIKIKYASAEQKLINSFMDLQLMVRLKYTVYCLCAEVFV